MSDKKIFTTEKGVVDKENNKLIGVIGSTGTIDRHGESVNPEGWLVKNYLKNPVILYGHDYSTLPVGRAEKVYVEDKKLKFDIKFADHDFAKDVFQLFADKILSAFSVGFIPKKYGVSGQDKFDIMEQELLELSVVTVPANPEALALVKSMELKHKEDQDETQELPLTEEKSVEVEEVIDEVKSEDTEVVEETIPEVVEETPEVVEVPSEEQPANPISEEVVPDGETPSPEEIEAKANNEETLKLLREMASLFKKADNSVGEGLAILKRLKGQLQN